MAEKKKRKKIRTRINTIHNRPSVTGKPELDKHLYTLAETMFSRYVLEDRLGKSYYPSTGGAAKRDLYKALGYVKSPTFGDYYSRYKRQDIAKRIVSAPVSASWRKKPEISEKQDAETKFEKAWAKLLKERRIYYYLSRADKISGIGRFGVILLGFGDGEKLNKPLTEGAARGLYYIRPYTERSVEINKWEENTKDPRYGLPLTYNLNVNTVGATASQKKKVEVHHSRIIHIAEDLVDDDIYGTPRLEPVLNRLFDLELISGGSSEMFWRGGFPGYAFTLDPEANVGAQALEDLEDEIQDYLHELQRYIRLQGIEVKALEVQIADPTNHIEVLVGLIAACIGMPKRILMGSERGELASTQDERAWADRIDERRREFVEPVILRKFIDKLIFAGVLPEPDTGEYTIDWPDLIALGDKDMMEIAVKAMDAFSKYINAGGDSYMPFETFAKKFLKFTDDELEQMKELRGKEFDLGLGKEETEEEEEIESEEFDETGNGAASTALH